MLTAPTLRLLPQIKGRGFMFASLRTHLKSDKFTATAVLMSPPGKDVDLVTVEKEFYEMGDKLNVTVDVSAGGLQPDAIRQLRPLSSFPP